MAKIKTLLEDERLSPKIDWGMTFSEFTNRVLISGLEP